MPTRTRKPDADDATERGVEKLRIDKWLWAARFYKTRSLAADAVEAGQVRVNGERVKPSRAVHAGERVLVRKGGHAWDVEVTGISDRRGSATDASLLYSESEASIKARELEVAKRRAVAAEAGAGRPTKRQRRKLEDFLNEP